MIERLTDNLRLNEEGEEIVARFVRECEAKRKEILDAGKDTGNMMEHPSRKDIIEDVQHFGLDENGLYENTWYVTDHYESDKPLCLTVEDFIQEDSGYTDDYYKKLRLGDKVKLLGTTFEIIKMSGAWGIGSPNGDETIPWDELKKYVPEYHEMDFMEHDYFISFFELMEMFSVDTEEEYGTIVPMLNGVENDPEYVYRDWKDANEK